MKLIDKDKVVAKIERLKSIYSDNENIHHVARYNLLVNILSFLDTLEVKDVVAEQEGICNGILNTIIGDTWHVKIPLNKVGLKHGNKVKIFITKGE